MLGYRMRIIALPAFAVWLFAAPALAGNSPATAGAAAFIKDLADNALTSLTTKDITIAERQKRFRELLSDAFDMPVIGRFVLGRHWRKSNPAQREEFLSLFEDFVVQAYANRFANYNGEQFQVDEVRPAENAEIVYSRIVRPDGPAIRIEWRVMRPDGKNRITDVVVEGVSMGITQRAEFASVIRQSGGKLEGLLAALRKKTARN